MSEKINKVKTAEAVNTAVTEKEQAYSFENDTRISDDELRAIPASVQTDLADYIQQVDLGNGKATKLLRRFVSWSYALKGKDAESSINKATGALLRVVRRLDKKQADAFTWGLVNGCGFETNADGVWSIKSRRNANKATAWLTPKDFTIMDAYKAHMAEVRAEELAEKRRTAISKYADDRRVTGDFQTVLDKAVKAVEKAKTDLENAVPKNGDDTKTKNKAINDLADQMAFLGRFKTLYTMCKNNGLTPFDLENIVAKAIELKAKK